MAIAIDDRLDGIKMKVMEKQSPIKESSMDMKNANAYMALGAGVGTLGAASALLTGAVCPLCVIFTPGLIGFGAYQRWRAAKMIRRISNQPETVQNVEQNKNISAK